MRTACVLLVAVALGMAIGGAIGRTDTREPAMIAKLQDKPPLDPSTGELARARLSTE